jgi:SAM-dependent methyltransferase
LNPWDDYAPYYDWENTLTLGRRDLRFWRELVAREAVPALELGCGTGRLIIPLARAGADITGVDFSASMLAQASRRAKRLPVARRPALVRGDIRALPFASRSFGLVMASYGMLQSLHSDRDLDLGLAEAARVLTPGGRFGIDLVPDLPRWTPHAKQVTLRGRASRDRRIELVESVRQDRRRGLTIFDEEFVVRRRGGRPIRHRFSLTFRTVPMADIRVRLARAGFRIDAVLGDYRGAAWDEAADVWVILATRRQVRSSKLRVES